MSSTETATSIEERTLLEGIRDKYDSFIKTACASVPFPDSLLAALTANETGLDSTRTRFEANVFVELSDVFVGRAAAFGSIGAEDLNEFVLVPLVLPGDRSAAVRALRALMNLATSWGPTQIMGYQVLGYHGSPVKERAISDLTNLETHYAVCVELLEQFQKTFHLPDPSVDASGYFHCWNSGSPGGRTFDPNYAANGIRRMKLYETLPQPAAPAQEETAT